MIKKIKIIAKTEKGDLALRKHFEESLKQKWIVKQMLKKTGFNQELDVENQTTLTIWATPNSMFSMTKIPHIKEEIDTAMMLNEAMPEIDYYYEIEE